MVAYGIGGLPLTKRLKAVYPGVTYPWYAHDAWELGPFDNSETYFNLLRFNVLDRGINLIPLKLF